MNVVFNPGGAPVATPVQDRVARFKAATTELSCTCADLAVRQRFFVPPRTPVEVWTLTIANQEQGCPSPGRDDTAGFSAGIRQDS